MAMLATRPTIDPCPRCGDEVLTLHSVSGRPSYLAEPCLHRVKVTMWPDRVELADAQ